MSFQFIETFQLQLPEIGEKLVHFQESEFNSSHGLIVEISAVHVGTTANYNHYSEKTLESSLTSWLQPYPKPIILNHDTTLDPIGRVVGARMDKESDGTPFTRLQAAIVDPSSVQKINDKRYLTGSVGGKATEAVCSICDVDWAAPSENSGLPCKHQRGNIYKGKLATLEMGGIIWNEYSFVNVPADSRSGLTQSSEEQDGWVRPVRFFVLDLKQESIVEYTQTNDVDVLGEMKKKDASPMYKEMKGAFIEARVVNKIEEESAKTYLSDTKSLNGIEENLEEKLMSQKDTTELENEDNILAVTEQLSEDLAVSDTVEESEEAEESTEESNENVQSEEEDSSEQESVSDEVTEEESEEAERPEGQEKAKAKDVDPETSKGAPISREEDSDEESEVTEDEDTDEDESDKEEEEADVVDNVHDDEVGEMQTQINTLQEENARLKKALHQTLAERVVDAKIAVGVIEAQERASSIEEHVGRSAASLADSLRDLASMKPVINEKVNLSLGVKSVIVEQEENTDTIDVDETSFESESDPEEAFVNSLTDVLMGRKKL